MGSEMCIRDRHLLLAATFSTVNSYQLKPPSGSIDIRRTATYLSIGSSNHNFGTETYRAVGVKIYALYVHVQYDSTETLMRSINSISYTSTSRYVTSTLKHSPSPSEHPSPTKFLTVSGYRWRQLFSCSWPILDQGKPYSTARMGQIMA